MNENSNNTSHVSRRSFLLKGSISTAGLLLAPLATRASILDFARKPNSKFFGVQVGVITYSYRSMPHDVKQLLKYVVESGFSAIELMGESVEDYAGKPSNKNKVAEWRSTVSMD